MTGPAGCGKTFVIRLLMEICNRFVNTDGHCNAYITCASTGKAAVAIDGTTVHTALKISLSRLLPLSVEVVQQYRVLFQFVKVLIIDEVSMISAELLSHIDARLKQITGKYDVEFGGIDIILIGDLRQLPPVRATPIYNQTKQHIAGPTLWRSLKFFELDQVMRQANQMFSNILTKIGNGTKLENNEKELLESRFFTKEQTEQLCPHGLRLFLSNNSVNGYNHSILSNIADKIVSTATDAYIGCHSANQEAFIRQKIHKMSVIDTGGLPYEITLVIGKPYLITTNIDVSDGITNGAMGILVHIHRDNNDEITRIWLEFTNTAKIGQKMRVKESFSSYCCMRSHNKSQGGTVNEVVYEYDKTRSQQLMYVAMSRVTTINGLYIVTKDDSKVFNHGRRNASSMDGLQSEFRRLALNRLSTIDKLLNEFITTRKGLAIYSFNCQSLRKHAADFNSSVMNNSHILMFSETCLKNNENIDVPNFDCVVQFKRDNVRNGGVAIYQKSNKATAVLMPNTDITLRQITSLSVNAVDVGEICAARCLLDNGQIIMTVVVYISPNQSIPKIMQFIHEVLALYTHDVAAIVNVDYDKIPMIMSGDFNVNFAAPKAEPLLQFLESKLNLKMNNHPALSTTKYGTTIYSVFSRYLNKLESTVYVSYFSYHKPLLSVLEYDSMEIKE
ncbi:hypothetical protein KPH14_011884 [Odynerus spinipes]|uniref:ATP-dependent DNA helicase n=1 Tax=Odynerus spinipes TaxID=1348599 RepID=A0AAD9R9L0_9HYME|nr:hypothetical protein KPH14_011884 [Odynerus spinipes]